MLDLKVESLLFEQGFDFVVGIDEVGRGCWAGPLYMCGFLVTPDSSVITGVNDSKKLSRQKREKISDQFSVNEYYLAKKSSLEIDRCGLGDSLKQSLKEILNYFTKIYEGKKIKFLVDGSFSGEWEENIEFIVKGDSKVYSIASASIVAKVSRDRFMQEMHAKFPQYGFDDHVGYGTKKHSDSIDKYGIIDIHRKSFGPIKKYIVKDKDKDKDKDKE